MVSLSVKDQDVFYYFFKSVCEFIKNAHDCTSASFEGDLTSS